MKIISLGSYSPHKFKAEFFHLKLWCVHPLYIWLHNLLFFHDKGYLERYQFEVCAKGYLQPSRLYCRTSRRSRPGGTMRRHPRGRDNPLIRRYPHRTGSIAADQIAYHCPSPWRRLPLLLHRTAHHAERHRECPPPEIRPSRVRCLTARREM